MDETVQRLETLIRDAAPHAQQITTTMVEELSRRGSTLALPCFIAVLLGLLLVIYAFVRPMRTWVKYSETYDKEKIDLRSEAATMTCLLLLLGAVLIITGFSLGIGYMDEWLSPSYTLFQEFVK